MWNINSFAEYFLQIFGLYAKDYQAACDEIVHRREEMIERLSRFSFLTPYPSEANYVMCRVDGLSSKDLASRLLREDDLLLKDLSPKNGFDGRDFIRIAVRDSSDNEALYKAFEKIEA